MTTLRRTVTRCLLAAAGATVVTPMAWAQEPARPGGLEEIIVTAQKRAESAQDVPIALSVFDASALEESNIDRIEEIVMRTPNFTMMRVNVGEPQFYIRGVGSNSDSAAGDPTVGVFQDEIYVGRISGAAFDVFDMERVEVLRGPQGTLYGRNTSGGAVNFVPKRPEEELYAGAELSYGNYDSLEGRLVLNGGLTETLAGRLSVSHREHSGYSENITTGADLDDEDNWSLRGQLLVSPSDATRLLLGYDYVKDDAAGNARVPFPVFDTGQVGAANNAALVALRAIWPAGSDLRRAYSVPESSQERAINGLTARLEHETSIGDWTLLYGHRDVELSWYEDLDGLKPYGTPPIPAVYQPPYGWVLQNRDIADEEARQHSVELRLASPADAGLQWVAGLYYFREDVDRVERFVTQYSLAPVAGGDVTFVQEVESTSYAAFGQLTYPFSEQLSVTAGLRYSNDDKEARQAGINNDPAGDPSGGLPLFPGAPYDISADDSWSATTGKLGVEFRTADAQLLYASISKGFKSGIFPSQNNVVQNVGVATPPEEVWSYEVGAKTQWLDDTLRANVALFYMDYTDLQLFRLNGLVLQTFTEDTKNQGAELEVLAAPIEGLELGLNAAYLKAEVDGGVNDGGQLPRAPENTLGGFAQYAWPVAGGGLSVRADFKWTDDYRTEIPYNTGNAAADQASWRITEVESFALLDARATYSLDERNLEFAVWGKNLTDETYPTHIIPFLGNGFSIFGPPRTYGVSVSWKSR